MATKVLVTGGAGYLGAILCEHLIEKGYQVKVVDNLLYGQRTLFHLCTHRGFEFVRGDARDERVITSLMGDADVIIPLASIVGAPACERDPTLARSVNLDAIQMLKPFTQPPSVGRLPYHK